MTAGIKPRRKVRYGLIALSAFIVFGLLAVIPAALMSTVVDTNTGRPQKTIALVDDVKYVAESVTREINKFLPTVTVAYFPRCEILRDEMKAGRRFNVYLVDKEIEGGMWGPACTLTIMHIDSTSIVVGYSTDSYARADFMEAGAKDFFLKGDSPSVLIGILRAFLTP